MTKTLKQRALAALLGLGMTVAPYLATPVQAESQRKQNKAEIEFEIDRESDSLTSRTEVLTGEGQEVRLEHTNGPETSERYGMKLPITGSQKGHIYTFGTNGPQSQGSGINFDLQRGLWVVGGGIEEATSKGIDDKVLNLYTGIETPEVSADIGLAERTTDGNSKRILHGTFFKSKDNFGIGFGGSIDSDKDSYLHFVAGSWPKVEGKDFGWRFWGTSECDGNYVLDLILTDGSNFGRGAYECGFGRHESFHEKKISTVDNIMDYVVPPLPLDARTQKLGLELKYIRAPGKDPRVKTTGLIYPATALGAKLPKSLFVGATYDTDKDKLIPQLGGVAFKKLFIFMEKESGKKPFGFVQYSTKF